MKKSFENIKVVGLGQACLDCLGRISDFPLEDQKVELDELQIQCGGPASTALVALSRFGIKTSFLGSVSNDLFGLEIVRGLKRERVDFHFLKVTPGYSSQFAFIAVTQKNGNRTIFWNRGTVPHLKMKDVNLQPFSKAEILHLDGLMIEASQEAARQAKRMGLRVVLDAGTMREGSKELTALVDVLIASEKFVEPLVGVEASSEKALKALMQLGPEEVIITMGARGSIGWDGEKMILQKAFPVRAVDTTGAGDVYHGAYIYSMLQGWPMERGMRFASAVSALKCKKGGAREGIPLLDEVAPFMDRYPTF